MENQLNTPVIEFTERSKELLKHITPFYGLGILIKNRKKLGGIEGKFGDLMLGAVPLNLIEAIGIYKLIEHIIGDPNFFQEVWGGVELIGKYSFYI